MDEINRAMTDKRWQNIVKTLMRYKEGKSRIDSRVVSAENWWLLRNSFEQDKGKANKREGYKSESGWLHNVIVSKHADAMDSFPEPNFLPREPNDRAEAEKLSKIIPCILEQNGFEQVYSDNAWRKCKFGTGIYKTIWDAEKLDGLGDISILKSNILNCFWRSGVEDIQDSPYFFEVEFIERDELQDTYPELAGQNLTKGITCAKFKTEEHIDTTNLVPFIHCYYKKHGKLHLAQGVPAKCIYCSEDDSTQKTIDATDELGNALYDEAGNAIQIPDPEDKPVSEKGIYDHGRYPYTFDVLFPMENSPCGTGYTDICRSPQTDIDLMNTAAVENTIAGAKPRYFIRGSGSGINEEEFLDINKTMVHVESSLDETALRPIDYKPLDGNYVAMIQSKITELRETSGNTETAAGSTSAGITAASAIAALQEASGKGSRDSAMTSYRAAKEICEIVVELVRQFYDIPRQFRITGEDGEEEFTSFSNEELKPQSMDIAGMPDAMRKPTFDIVIVPQKHSNYTKITNNELALQFFGLGFFNPEMVDQATACLEMMDFDSKNEILKKIKENGTMYDKYLTLLQISLMLAQESGNTAALQQIQMLMTQSGQTPMMTQAPEIYDGAAEEHPFAENARARTEQSTSPTEGGEVNV